MGYIVYPHLSPRLIEITEDTDIDVQDLYNGLRAWEDSIPGMDYLPLVSGAGKEALSDTVSVGITITLLNAQVFFTPRTTIISSGIVTEGDSEGDLLIDSTSNFPIEGVYPGCTLYNKNDDSLGFAITVDTTSIVHYQLTGGTRNNWLIGDEYIVWPNQQCSISGGNLVAVNDVGVPISAIFPSPGVQILATSSASATLQELVAIQYSSYNEGVTVDIINGVSGTSYNIGTPSNPVNNLTDALTIAHTEGNGFSIFYIKESMTIDTGLDFTDIIFRGQSVTKTLLTIHPNANVTRSEFYEASINGTLDGQNKLKNCLLKTLNFINGVVEECLLDAYTITLGGGVDAYFLDCWSAVAGVGTPTIDMGGSGQNLGLRNYNGVLKIQNMNGDNNISIDMNSARIVLASTISNGTVVCRGIGELVDEAGDHIESGTWNGVTIVNSSIDSHTISKEVWNALIIAHNVTGTFGELIQKIKKDSGLIPGLM
jgi:hypothetical protein